MGYEGLLEYLVKDIENQKEKILKKAQEEIEEIKKAGEKEIASMKDAALAKARREIDTIRSKRIYEAQKSAQEPILSAKSGLLESVFEKVGNILADIPKRKDYPNMLEKLLNEALEDCEGKVEVAVNKRDAAIVQSLLDKKGIDYTLNTSDELIGGVECTLLNGKKRIRNTIEARFQRAKPFLRAKAAQMLFQ